MGRLDRPALRGTLLGTALRLWNPVMKRLLASRFHWPWSRWFLVISWMGRKTGRAYHTPVSYVREDDALLITTGDGWWRNLVGPADVDVWIRGHKQRALAHVVLDEEESIALHERMFADQPLFALLAGLSRRRGRGQITRSIRAGRKLIRVQLV